jgi:hypothetical protein
MAAVVLIIAISAGAAEAQRLRDGVQGLYGGIGAYGGGLCCGPGGAIVGGAAGSAAGGWVYDTHRNFLRQPRRYAPSHASPRWVHRNTTPMYLRRRY